MGEIYVYETSQELFTNPRLVLLLTGLVGRLANCNLIITRRIRYNDQELFLKNPK